MAKPYKASHDKLIDAIGTADKYHQDWRTIATDMTRLVTATGFDPKAQSVGDSIRKKIAGAVSEGAALRQAASGTDAAANKRALALKTVRHLYFYSSFGRQKIWILSLPKALKGFPVEYEGKPAATVDLVLGTGNEKFDQATMKTLGEACQTGLAWVQAAMIVCGAPLEPQNRRLFRRWFVPAGAANEATKITAWAAALNTHLIKIASGLKAGEVILTDSPDERGSGSNLEKSEAFVFTTNDLITVYVEEAFFSPKNTLSGKTNWARIMVHELTHAYCKTKDHSYSWQGLLPRDDDAFKTVNDTYVTRSPGFPAVRALTFDQCKDNADSWAFFCADAAGALSETDRIQALGSRLYDLGGETAPAAMVDALKRRAA
jgi:hypothetical protein